MRVVILGSGRGSNAEAILLAKQKGSLGRAEVVQIFSDQPVFDGTGAHAVRYHAGP